MIVDPILLEVTVEDLCTRLDNAEKKLERLNELEKKMKRLDELEKKLEGAMERMRELESATNMHKQIEKDDYHDPSVFDDLEILSSDQIPEWYQSSPITRPSYNNYQTPPYYQLTTDFHRRI